MYFLIPLSCRTSRHATSRRVAGGVSGWHTECVWRGMEWSRKTTFGIFNNAEVDCALNLFLQSTKGQQGTKEDEH